jgi:hypothetical protein
MKGTALDRATQVFFNEGVYSGSTCRIGTEGGVGCEEMVELVSRPG